MVNWYDCIRVAEVRNIILFRIYLNNIFSGSGRMPWATNDPKKMYKQIATAKYSFSNPEWVGISDDAKSFISSLLVVDPALRMIAMESVVIQCPPNWKNRRCQLNLLNRTSP